MMTEAANIEFDEQGSWNWNDSDFLLKLYLHQDEIVIWSGKPSWKRFRWEAWLTTIDGIRWAVMGVIFTVCFVVALLSRKVQPGVWLVPVLSISATYWVVKVLALAVPRTRRRLAETIYAVTNQRALLVNGFGCARGCNFMELGPAVSIDACLIKSRKVKRRRRDGSGDIIFDLKKYRYPGVARLEFGFFGVSNVDDVDRALHKIVGKSPLRDFDFDPLF